tara:strand:- start:50 stop:532 length:483 start_codon:yes stop_codon:yes gene_type:complete
MMVQSIEMKPVSRRILLQFGGAGALALLSTSLLPGLAKADAKAASESIKKLIGNKKIREGRITIEAPQIAENGNTVPIGFEVDSPMTDADHVKSVHIFADENPSPDVASFHFSAASGRAKANTRMRMIKTQNILAVAEMNDGSVFMAKAPVKVTIGGCGG